MKMAMIPTAIYEEIEHRLKTRDVAISSINEELMLARAKAYDISAPISGTGGGKTHNNKSRVERAAIELDRIERKYQTALKWDAVFKRLDILFPDDSNVGFVASLMYGNGMSQEDVCRACGTSRQTVRRIRDKYIIHAALIAASFNLIEVKDIDIDQEDGSSFSD